MMIHKITTFEDNNQWLKYFDTQLNKPTNNNSFKIPKDVMPIYKKFYNKTLGLV